ncbi:hypothetical protein AB3329_07865 [Streptococcus sp. H31]
MTIFNWIFSSKKEVSRPKKEYPKGFIDFDTGRYVEVDPVTRREVFID